MSDDFHNETPPSAHEMGGLAFALANADAYGKYIALRVHGIHSIECFRRAFPMEWWEGSNGPSRVNSVEFNPYVVSKLRDALALINPAELWNPKISVHEILSLARDPYAKDSSRLGAMKELNILLNITVVDENGKTKAGRSLDDFYADIDRLTAGGAGNAAGDALPMPAKPETQIQEGPK